MIILDTFLLVFIACCVAKIADHLEVPLPWEKVKANEH